MDRHCQSDPEARFYLTTDTPRARRLIQKRYGVRVLAHGEAPVEEGAWMRHALVKILTMARAERIYNSHNSSFSFISHLISNRPFICVALRKRPEGWHENTLDNIHDRFLAWDHERRLWRKNDLPKASATERLLAEVIFWRARFFCSKYFQLWPWHRLGPLE